MLLRIFEAGYLTTPSGGGTSYTYSRRRKPFVSLVRQVCRHWRLLVDRIISPRTHYTRVCLDCGKTDFYGRLINIVGLFAKFKHYLTTSNGCDVSVRLCGNNVGRDLPIEQLGNDTARRGSSSTE
jgi:hypothetical protein